MRLVALGAPAFDVLEQILVEPLQRDVVLRSRLVKASSDQLHDVRVIQLGKRLALAEERLALQLGVQCVTVVKLQRYEPTVAVVASLVDSGGATHVWCVG